MKKNNPSDRKDRKELPGGGSMTTSIGKDGNKTITISGASNIRIDRAGKVYSGQSTSHYNNLFSGGSSSSRQVSKTGVTFKEVSSLNLNSQQVKKMSEQTPHTFYKTSDEYKEASSKSSAQPRP